MSFIINIIFCVLSFLFVVFSPDQYSYPFIIIVFILFIIQNLLYFKLRKNKRLICFEFFFFIAFFFTNFVYPVFYFNENPTFLFFSLPYNYSIISKATAIAFFAYSSFLLGISYKQYKNRKIGDNYLINTISNYNLSNSLKNKICTLFLVITLFFFFFYLVTGGLESMAAKYRGDASEEGISGYFYILFFTSSIILALFTFDISNKKRFIVLLFLIIFVILFLLSGSRTYPLAIIIILMYSYDNYKKISNTRVILITSIGFLFLALVMLLRNYSYNIQNIKDIELNSFWDIGTDLIINNRNLYVLIDYCDKYGPNYGLTMLGGLLSPIPFGQSIFLNLTGIQSDFISSAKFSTFLAFGPGSQLGSGSNIVGDIYVSFGLIGILPFFFFLGWIVEKSRSLGSINVYWKIVHGVILSNSVFIVRSGMFDNLRYVIWALLLTYIIINFTHKKI